MPDLNLNPFTLIIIAGPTAVGKTRFAIELAEHLRTEIISADSRQFFKELNIGTAKPSEEELQAVPHHFIGQLSIHDYYNVSRYEQDVMEILSSLVRKHQYVIMTGGSGLYIDAVCRGVDDFPDPDPELRSYLKGLLADEGIEKLQEILKLKDPDYYITVDLANPNRLIRALEVTMATGVPFSSQRMNQPRQRNFNIIKIGLELPRQELVGRIHFRVDQMIENGLIDEARELYIYKHLNALNTVGYKELFEYFDGYVTLEQAIENIKTHTRRYAKRQLTWFRKDKEYKWFGPGDVQEVLELIKSL
ncbi:MAG: tRNA (adenosine(37)-N6)-dimethylallyltransferase MiaA [Bacteroidetes bacterium]|nr:tRNA (adenosine(37)-N6)-dimethylallyltransferase MiaA [Bacteroidota bacterium]